MNSTVIDPKNIDIKKTTKEDLFNLLQTLNAKVNELESERNKGRGGARINRVRPDWNFPVAIALLTSAKLDNKKELEFSEGLDPIRVVSREVEKNGKNIDEILSVIMGEKYVFVSNEELVKHIEKQLTKAGFSAEEKLLYCGFDGLTFAGRYNQKNPTVKIDGEKYSLQFVIDNGYSGKDRPTIFSRGIRADGISFNIPSQPYVLSKDGKLVDETTETCIKQVSSEFEKTMEIFEAMAKIKLTHDEGANVLARLCEKDFMTIPVWGKRAAKPVKDMWIARKDNLNLFGLYLCAAEYFNTKVEAPTDKGGVNQLERSNSSQTYLLNNFIDATNDKDILKSLTVKATIDLEKARETREENEAQDDEK